MKTRFTTVDIITVLEELQPVISPIEQDGPLFAVHCTQYTGEVTTCVTEKKD
jgi:hypothetical protein